MCSPADGSPISTSPGDNSRAIHDAVPIDDAHDESRDVVFTVRIEPRHLRRLPTEERTAVFTATSSDTGDDLFGNVRRKPPRRQIVEKEERTGALDQDVVDAVVHEIVADRIVSTAHEGNLQLRADAIGARHEHRLLEAITIQFEESAERSDLRQTPGVNVARASCLMRRTVSLPASISTPD